MKCWEWRPALRTVALTIATFCLFGSSGTWAEASPAPIPGLPGFGGPFALTDQFGHPRTDQDFRGKLLLVAFGFTGCASVCPLQLQKISAALEESPPDIASRVVTLFITVDPQHDTPEKLRQYLRAFHPSIIGLTGSSTEIAKVVHDYHVHVSMSPPGGPSSANAAEIDHSDLQYLMGPDGKFLTLLLPNLSAADIAARLSKYAART